MKKELGELRGGRSVCLTNDVLDSLDSRVGKVFAFPAIDAGSISSTVYDFLCTAKNNN